MSNWSEEGGREREEGSGIITIVILTLYTLFTLNIHSNYTRKKELMNKFCFPVHSLMTSHYDRWLTDLYCDCVRCSVRPDWRESLYYLLSVPASPCATSNDKVSPDIKIEAPTFPPPPRGHCTVDIVRCDWEYIFGHHSTVRCDECRLTGSETTSLRNRVKPGVETGEEAGASRQPADTTQLEGNLLRPFKTQTTIIDNELTQLRRRVTYFLWLPLLQV